CASAAWAASGLGGRPAVHALLGRAPTIHQPVTPRASRRVRCFGSPHSGRADMDEARGVWHSLGLLLQATLPTVLLLVVCVAYVVAAVRYARTESRSGRARAVPPSANRLRRH